MWGNKYVLRGIAAASVAFIVLSTLILVFPWGTGVAQIWPPAAATFHDDTKAFSYNNETSPDSNLSIYNHKVNHDQELDNYADNSYSGGKENIDSDADFAETVNDAAVVKQASGAETAPVVYKDEDKGNKEKEEGKERTEGIGLAGANRPGIGYEMSNVQNNYGRLITKVSPGRDVVARNGRVSLVNWYGNAEKIFSIGSRATVIDIDSGLSFRVERTYGYNHADVETLTTKDTEILKKAAGGEWNWNRRAVLVEVNGYRMAASMAPMPHAGIDSVPANKYLDKRSGGYGPGANLDKIKKNGMDGHFDIHFLQSRTHDTNRVDSQHQLMIERAFMLGF